MHSLTREKGVEADRKEVGIVVKNTRLRVTTGGR